MEHQSSYPPGYILNWELTLNQAELSECAMQLYLDLLFGGLRLDRLPPVLLARVNEPAELGLALDELRAALFPQPNASETDQHLHSALYNLVEASSKLVSLRRNATAGATTLTLPLTEGHMRVVADGLEFYSRLLGGQFGELHIPDLLRGRVLDSEPDLGPIFRRITRRLYPGLPFEGRRGVGWSTDPVQQALQRSCELYKTLLKFDMNSRHINNVHSGSILHYSDWPLALVTPYPQPVAP